MPFYSIHPGLNCLNSFTSLSNLLSTASFPPNPPHYMSTCNGAWRACADSEKRGHTLSLISACALGEFRRHELQNPALRPSAISCAEHVPCKPFEDTVREMGTLPAGALGTASPQEPSSCVKGSTRNPANMYQGNIFSLFLLRCFLWFSANTVSSQPPCCLGYKAGQCACSLLQQHRIAEDSLCPLSSFF